MKILSIIGYSMMGLCFGSLVALMQLSMFYMMFISEQSNIMPMVVRVILFLFALIISIGWSVEVILREIRNHNLIKAFKEIE